MLKWRASRIPSKFAKVKDRDDTSEGSVLKPSGTKQNNGSVQGDLSQKAIGDGVETQVVWFIAQGLQENQRSRH
jgi:hypothetical protein